MKEKDVMITTIDNPFNPFLKFDDWMMYDQEHDYNTLSRLDRMCKMNDQMTDKEQEQAIVDAIDAIVMADFLNIYIKVEEPDDYVDPDTILLKDVE